MDLLSNFKIYYWPGLLLGLYIITVITTYLIAVLSGHVYSIFPYISDTGAIPPESCIFGQLFNIIAVVLGITLYIRYRQVDFGIKNGTINVSRTLNTITLWLAVGMCFGTSVVANFQETSIFVVHTLGATLVFGSALVYFIIQTRISFKSTDDIKTSKYALYLRVVLSSILIILFPIIGVCGLAALKDFEGRNMIWWTEAEGGFELHLAATFSEWILVSSIFVYIFTFTEEFRRIKFKGVTFENKTPNLNESNRRMV